MIDASDCHLKDRWIKKDVLAREQQAQQCVGFWRESAKQDRTFRKNDGILAVSRSLSSSPESLVGFLGKRRGGVPEWSERVEAFQLD